MKKIKVNSLHTFEKFVELMETLPGSYEVAISSCDGEEGVLFCGNKIIRKAACKDLSGMNALGQILSWDGINFNIRKVAACPEQDIYVPINYLLKVLREKTGAGIF